MVKLSLVPIQDKILMGLLISLEPEMPHLLRDMKVAPALTSLLMSKS